MDAKPYLSLSEDLKRRFGHKVYKLALDGGMTCPNRDGRLGTGGCIFCSRGGSGEFAAPRSGSAAAQIQAARQRVSAKTDAGHFIAYFQSYTNTYAPVDYLRALFGETLEQPCVEALSIATRPDCLPEETVGLLKTLNCQKPVWVELGLQTIHPSTAAFIRRGYDLSCFDDAVIRLKEAGLTVVVHVILGLPGETQDMMLQTIRHLGNLPVDGVKLQLLHILKGTDLASLYQIHPFPVFTMEQYVDCVIDCVERLPPSVVIHRLTGDGPRSLLLAPLWSADKRRVLNSIHRRFRERGAFQGRLYQRASGAGLQPA